MRLFFIYPAVILFTFFFYAKPGLQFDHPPFNPGYVFKKSSSIIQDKNFYLLTLFEKLPEAAKAVRSDKLFAALLELRIHAIQSAAAGCRDSIGCFTKNLQWTPAEVARVSDELSSLYQDNPAIKSLVSQHMRPSGYFQRYADLKDDEMLVKAWEDAAEGMNYIIRAYTTNQGLRYKNIDSVTYALNSEYYHLVIREMMLQVKEQIKDMRMFFQPVLNLDLELLFINDRDEAARHEPLALENEKAYARIPTIKWADFPYSVILTPGEGPENNMPISPNGKYRCRLAAERFNQKLAPFIIVSGGYVHPFQTMYCEAIEMKKYLVKTWHIPENAIIIEPHARHTTTNFRNAARIMFRCGIPPAKKALCSTTLYQADYIADENFRKVNMSYLKYLPFESMKRLNEFDIEFTPSKNSLQMDSLDPLDP